MLTEDETRNSGEMPELRVKARSEVLSDVIEISEFAVCLTSLAFDRPRKRQPPLGLWQHLGSTYQLVRSIS